MVSRERPAHAVATSTHYNSIINAAINCSPHYAPAISIAAAYNAIQALKTQTSLAAATTKRQHSVARAQSSIVPAIDNRRTRRGTQPTTLRVHTLGPILRLLSFLLYIIYSIRACIIFVYTQRRHEFISAANEVRTRYLSPAPAPPPRLSLSPYSPVL